MPDATAQLSKLLSTAKGRRTMDDLLNVHRCKPTTKTLLSTTNARSYVSSMQSNSFLEASYGSSSASNADGGESTNRAASVRFVRSYAARVKQMPPSPEKKAFGAYPPLQPPQGDSFIDRGHGGSFQRESLRHRQPLSSPPPPVSRKRSTEPSRGLLRAKHCSTERAPSGRKVLHKAASGLVERRIIAVVGLPTRTRSDDIRPSPLLASPPLRRASTGLQAYPHASQRRLPTLLLERENVFKTVSPNISLPAWHHVAVPNGRRTSTSEIQARRATPARLWEPLAWLIPDALPRAPSPSKRLRVRRGARPS